MQCSKSGAHEQFHSLTFPQWLCMVMQPVFHAKIARRIKFSTFIFTCFFFLHGKCCWGKGERAFLINCWHFMLLYYAIIHSYVDKIEIKEIDFFLIQMRMKKKTIALKLKINHSNESLNAFILSEYSAWTGTQVKQFILRSFFIHHLAFVNSMVMVLHASKPSKYSAVDSDSKQC